MLPGSASGTSGPPAGRPASVRAVAALAITGSTGNVGGRVARLLAAAGVEQRLLVRDPSRAPDLPGSSVVRASYGDGEAARRALDGVRTLFMVSAAESATRVEEHASFIDAAAAAGVEHVVYTSFFGAAPDCVFTLGRDHYATEVRIKAAGMAWTFLRDNLYLDFFPLLVGGDGVIRGPAGQGRTAAVAQDDIAEAAVAVLGEPAAHAGRVYDVTGPEDIGLAAAAAVLAEHRGTPVTFHDETVEEAYASRASYGAPDWQVDAWVSTYTSIGAGEMAGVTDHVPRLTGHPARSLRDVLGR